MEKYAAHPGGRGPRVHDRDVDVGDSRGQPNLFSQQIVGAPWRHTTAAIINIGMGLGWASAAALGGLAVDALDFFRGMFFVVIGLASIGAVLTWAISALPSRRCVSPSPINLVASTPGRGYPRD